MNNQPAGWINVTLNEVTLTRKGKKPASVSPTKISDDYLPYLLIDEIENKGIRSYTNDITVPKSTEEDVLLVWDGSIGKCNNGLIGAVGSTIVIVKPIIINSDYLKYFLLHSREFIHQTKTGSSIPHINRDFFNIRKIPIAPLNEQKRIADKLNQTFNYINSLNKRLEAIPEMIKDLRQSILNDAFTGKLTSLWRLNNHFKKVVNNSTLGDESNFITSGSRGWAKFYSSDGSKFIRAQNISNDILDLSNVAHVKLPEKSEGTRTLIQQNDLLITITGANVTKTAHVNTQIKNAYVSQHVGLVRLNETVNSKYVYYYLISESHGRGQLLDSAYGQGKPQLNLTNLKDVKLDLPPIKEQREIVSKVENYFSLTDKIEKRFHTIQNQLIKLPQSLLSKAFKGELVPQDPNDESAEKLLERIQAEINKLKKRKQ